MIYLDTNVFEEALNRIRFVYDNFDDVIVSMSGGKDSTVLFHLALLVAEERNRLPLKVFWLDQEAEWQGTVDYMTKIMSRPDVDPYWFQVRFAFPNNLSTTNKTLMAWDESAKDRWCHPQSELAITELPELPVKINVEDRDTAFYDLVKYLPEWCCDEDAESCAVLVGMRIAESPARRMAIANANGSFRGITWCASQVIKTRKLWPIYDFSNDDIWAAIANNHWEYNNVYDKQYQWGLPKKDMRVSALIHETAWRSIEQLQEFEPQTYNKYVFRIHGTSAVNHSIDEGGLMPDRLPFAFESWKEYRDYLLEKLIPLEDRETYLKRWKNQEGDDWYQTHVREIILNDTCGTLNKNRVYTENSKKRLGSGSKYEKKRHEQFEAYMREKANHD